MGSRLRWLMRCKIPGSGAKCKRFGFAARAAGGKVRAVSNWYYAENGRQQGPVTDEAEWNAMIAEGTILPETLVWREGMERWLPYGKLTPPPVGGRASVCTECNRLFPLDELTLLGMRRVCAECEPTLRRQLAAVSGARERVDAATLMARVEASERSLSIGCTLSRAWAVIRKNFWPCVGLTLLGYALMLGAGLIPLLGIVATFCVQPQMTAGLYWYFLKQIRGRKAVAADIFAGFGRGYAQQLVYMLIMFAVAFAVVLPFGLVMPLLQKAAHHGTHEVHVAMQIGGALLVLVLVVALLLLFTCWTFAPILILDKGLNATEAMRLSFRAVSRVLWKFVLLMLALIALSLCGMLALVIGVIFAIPVVFASIAVAYEDIFGVDAAAASDEA